MLDLRIAVTLEVEASRILGKSGQQAISKDPPSVSIEQKSNVAVGFTPVRTTCCQEELGPILGTTKHSKTQGSRFSHCTNQTRLRIYPAVCCLYTPILRNIVSNGRPRPLAGVDNSFLQPGQGRPQSLPSPTHPL